MVLSDRKKEALGGQKVCSVNLLTLLRRHPQWWDVEGSGATAVTGNVREVPTSNEN